MSEETKTEVTEAAEASEGKTKKKFINENTLEILVAIFLGITALLTAWATWIGSLHGGNQATNYTTSNNLASEGNAEYVAGIQQYFSDLLAWNTMMEYYFEEDIYTSEGNQAAVDTIEAKLDNYIQQNGSQILYAAVNEMTAQGLTSPFDVEGVTESYFEKANELLAESQALLEQGKEDNANGDAYNLVNVIYSVVLFMLGIIGIFRRIPNRAIVLLIAIIALVAATIYMCTIPLPTGFDLMSYFNG